jgi:hypothetical protein
VTPGGNRGPGVLRECGDLARRVLAKYGASLQPELLEILDDLIGAIDKGKDLKSILAEAKLSQLKPRSLP